VTSGRDQDLNQVTQRLIIRDDGNGIQSGHTRPARSMQIPERTALVREKGLFAKVEDGHADCLATFAARMKPLFHAFVADSIRPADRKRSLT
jgi:hypothetical protein